MNHESKILERTAELRKIRVHDPFAEFLHAQSAMHSFEISLLDCYRMAGHACHAITGAFLATEAAIARLYPETKTCERGDLKVEFGSALGERATGPRSNVVSFITGAWAESGFPGLNGNFKRKDLLSYGSTGLEKSEVRFSRVSDGKSVVIAYDSAEFVAKLGLNLDFPEKWRAEISAILDAPGEVLKITECTAPR
jgi:hypothetical protein